MKTGNIFDVIAEPRDHEVFDTLIRRQGVHIERIISKGHATPDTGWFDQDHNEWVMIVKGAATLSIKGRSDINMLTGDYINLPAHTLHRVKWTDPKSETIWLAIHY